MEESTCLQKNYLLNISGNYFLRKVRSESKLPWKPTVVYISSSVLQFKWYAYLTHAECAKLWILQCFCWEPFLFQRVFEQNLLESSRKNSVKNWMQLPLHIPSPQHFWDAIHGFFRPEGATKFYSPSEKVRGFQLLSPRSRRRRCLVHRKFRPRINTTLLKHLTKKQTDLTNGFVENKCHNYET